jgi:hypothetical protein
MSRRQKRKLAFACIQKCAIATGVVCSLLYSFHSTEVNMSLGTFEELFANVSARDTPAATYEQNRSNDDIAKNQLRSNDATATSIPAQPISITRSEEMEEDTSSTASTEPSTTKEVAALLDLEEKCELRDLSNYTRGYIHRTKLPRKMALADCLRFNCTKNVETCDNMLPTNYDGSDPPCCTHILRDMSRVFDNAMCSLGLDYTVVFGTLLGLARSDRIIPWTGDNDYALQNKNVANAMVDLWDTNTTGMAHLYQDINRMCVTTMFAEGKLQKWSIGPTSDTLFEAGFPYIDFYIGRENGTHFSEIKGCHHNTRDVWPSQRVSVYGKTFFQKMPAKSEQLLRTYYGPKWRNPPPDKKKNLHGYQAGPCQWKKSGY